MSSFTAAYGYARFGYSSYGFVYTESTEKNIYGLRSTHEDQSIMLKTHIVVDPLLTSRTTRALVAYWNNYENSTYVALRSYVP